MRTMLRDYTDDDLEMYEEEDYAIAFSNLFRENQATYFDVDSNVRTIKRYLGERAAQVNGLLEEVTDKRVPHCVFLLLRFITCREIQRNSRQDKPTARPA